MFVVLRRNFYEETAYRHEFYGLALIGSSNNPDVLDERKGIELFFYSEAERH